MIEVFKTNIQGKTQSENLLGVLSQAFPEYRINIDLSDCDKVLRVEGDDLDASKIKSLVLSNGFFCEALEG